MLFDNSMNFIILSWDKFLSNRFGEERPIKPITDLSIGLRSNQKLQRRLALLKFTPSVVIIPVHSRILTSDHTNWIRTNIMGRYHIHTTTVRMFFELESEALSFYFNFG